MAGKFAEATLVLSIDSAGVGPALNKLTKDADETAKSVKEIGLGVKFEIFTQMASAFGRSLKGIVDGFVELGNRGALVDDVAQSFQVLTEKTGGSADVMLGALRQGVVGTLSDFSLMQLATKTLGSGLIKTADDMGVLAAGARTLAKGAGGTTAEAFDTLTSAIASGRTATLKQIGVFVDAKVATENWAAAHKTTTSAMTDADRATALSAATLEALKNRMKEIQPDAADFGELIDQAKVRLENFKDQVALGIAQSPVFTAGMSTMGKALGEAFGTDTSSLASGFVKILEKIVIAVLDVGQGAVIIGHIFATVFSAIEVLANGLRTGFLTLGTGIVTVVDGLAGLQASLPFASQGSKDLAAATTQLKAKMEAMTVSAAASTAEAMKGVVGQGALHEKLDAVGGVILRVRDAMVEAQGKTAENTKAVVELGKAAPEAAAKNQDAADKIAAAFRDLNAEIVAGTKIGLEKRLFEIDAARQKVIDRINADTSMTKQQQAEMVRLTNEKYAQQTTAAILSGDQILAKEREVQQAIALQYMSGTAAKIAQLTTARDAEIAALAYLKANNEQRYNEDVAAVNRKYGLEISAVQGYYASVEAAMAANGFKTRTELDAQLVAAQTHLTNLEASHEKTASSIAAAKKKVHDIQIELDGKEAKSAKEKYDIIHDGAFSMMKSLFGKNKAAAISMAIIDTAAAVVSSFKNAGGFPWGLIPAAAMAAAGAVQIKTIRSTEGYAQGTPNLDFADFGAQSFQPLHNQEAVIPRGGGHILAGEIADAMPGQDELLSLVREMANGIRELPLEMRKGFRNAMLLDMA